MKKAILILISALALGGCATPVAKYDYTTFRNNHPHSILVLPARNETINVDAPDYFLSTLSRPFGERGYYVFPAHMVKRTLEDNGLSDTDMVYQAETQRIGRLFDCDAALYVTIERWDSQYVVLATQTTVQFLYELKSCDNGEVLWTNRAQMVYSPQASSSGNILADVIAQAIVAAVEKAAPNYMPLARQANLAAAATPGQGVPAGPYLPEQYRSDTEQY